MEKNNVLLLQPHVDSDIANILLLASDVNKGSPQEDVLELPQAKKGDKFSFHDLVSLAKHYDQRIYGDSKNNQDDDRGGGGGGDFSLTRPQLRALRDLGSSRDSSNSDSKDTGAQIAAATLLALGNLESTIRQCAGHTTGKAPLLSTMIGKLQNPRLIAVLQCLLLPHGGLNLRNLLWHGFVCGSLPRPWLALVLCLTQQLQNEEEQWNGRNKPKTDSDINLDTNWKWEYSTTLGREIAMGRQLQQDLPEFQSNVKVWLPVSHHPMFDLALSWCDTYPACATALLAVLLEHGLRLTWCSVNERPQHARAQTSQYYVTLDGHGQRNQHDLLLHPYVVMNDDTNDKQEVEAMSETAPKKNALVSHLGSSTMAFLADLFCSAAGPNIRATLGHGLWDGFLNQELAEMADNDRQTIGDTFTGRESEEDNAHPSTARMELQNVVSLMILALNLCAKPSEQRRSFGYNPKFSFTATTIQSLWNIKRELVRLFNLWESRCRHMTPSMEQPACAQELLVSLEELDRVHGPLVIMLTYQAQIGDHGNVHDDDDGSDDTTTYKELKLNEVLMSMGAVRTLLDDVCQAVEAYSASAEEALQLLDSHDDKDSSNVSSRQRKRASRIASNTVVALSLYTFAAFAGLQALAQKLLILPQESLEDEEARRDSDSDSSNILMMISHKDMLKVIERSRMVVSTASTMWTTNAERAVKAIQDYSRGKAVQQIQQWRRARNRNRNNS